MSVLTLHESTGWEKVQDHAVVVSLLAGKVAVFSGVEYEIWCSICEGKSEEQIVSAIAQIYDTPEHKVETDLAEFVSELRNQQFLK